MDDVEFVHWFIVRSLADGPKVPWVFSQMMSVAITCLRLKAVVERWQLMGENLSGRTYLYGD